MIVITFYTHHCAQLTHKALSELGVSSKMAPVPRALSSSCGSCVIAESDSLCESLYDEDIEAVYSVTDCGYTLLYSAE